MMALPQFRSRDMVMQRRACRPKGTWIAFRVVIDIIFANLQRSISFESNQFWHYLECLFYRRLIWKRKAYRKAICSSFLGRHFPGRVQNMMCIPYFRISRTVYLAGMDGSHMLSCIIDLSAEVPMSRCAR